VQKKFGRHGYKSQSSHRLGLIGTAARASIKDIGTKLLFDSISIRLVWLIGIRLVGFLGIRLVGLVGSGSGARVLCITSVHDLVPKTQEMTHACFSVRLDILTTVGGKGGGGGSSDCTVGNIFFLLRGLVSTINWVF
jgi:hypothetical protein